MKIGLYYFYCFRERSWSNSLNNTEEEIEECIEEIRSMEEFPFLSICYMEIRFAQEENVIPIEALKKSCSFFERKKLGKI